MKFAAIILCRMKSTRLENKVLLDIAGMPMIGHVIERARRFPGIKDDAVVLAIPEGHEDDVLVSVASEFGVNVFRGSEENVLERFRLGGRSVDAEVIYRVTADNPLVDQGVVKGTFEAFNSSDWDYAVMENTPLGTTSEIITMKALDRATELALTDTLREHPTLALYENSDRFRMNLTPCPDEWNYPDWRFTVDTQADYEFVRHILESLGADCTLETIIPYLLENPGILKMNSSVSQKGWDTLKEKKDEISGSRI